MMMAVRMEEECDERVSECLFFYLFFSWEGEA